MKCMLSAKASLFIYSILPTIGSKFFFFVGFIALLVVAWFFLRITITAAKMVADGNSGAISPADLLLFSLLYLAISASWLICGNGQINTAATNEHTRVRTQAGSKKIEKINQWKWQLILI